MIKIVLVIDDYKESLACQTLLKKLGFDIVSINKDSQFDKTILGFLPDIVIASFKTKNVDGIHLGARAKKLISKPRVLLLYTDEVEPLVAEELKNNFDFLLTSPFEFEQLIARTAEMARMDTTTLLAKYAKMRSRRPQQENQINSGFGGKDITKTEYANANPAKYQSTMASEVREARYKEFLERTKAEAADKVIDRKAMNMKVAMLEAELGTDPQIESINAQKLEFAKAMFRK
jgi:DNA-binding response OmpR family regulator